MHDLQLSLEHMTVLGMSPIEVIRTAEELGVDYASLIIDSGSFQIPIRSFLSEPAWIPPNAAHLASSPVPIHAAEGMALEVATDFTRAERICEIAATLGAERIVTLGMDPERSRTIDSMGRVCEIGARFGLQVSLEFVAPACVSTFEDAIEVVEGSGASNAAISVDILHLVRSGGSPADLLKRPYPIGAAQLCDGPPTLERERWWDEGIGGRLSPGEGAFPIESFINALPSLTIVGIEVPKGLAWPGDDLVADARRSVEAARAISPRLADVPGSGAFQGSTRR